LQKEGLAIKVKQFLKLPVSVMWRADVITASRPDMFREKGHRARRLLGNIRLNLGLSALLVYLGGCATPQPHLMTTPTIYKDERLDFITRLPPHLRATELPVFYATTRAPVKPGDSGHYSDNPGDQLRLGIAEVRLGEAGWTFDQLAASDWTSGGAEPRPGTVERIDELGPVPREQAMSDVERQMVERIDAYLAGLSNPVVVLYVPGYRVTFDEVAVMMGSFSAYLGHGVMVTFQWPTGQNFWNYLTDCPRAQKYVPDIERMIALLSRTRAQYINLIAYSCGSPLLGQALAQLRRRHPQEDPAQLARRYRIGNVIFVASDVDLKTFARDLVPSIMDLAAQTVVYFSTKDAALGFSRLVAGASRLGQPNIEELSARELELLATNPRFQAINVTNVRGAHEMTGMRGHGYWYANEWIATDVVMSLRFSIPPEKRCRVLAGKAKTVWSFPDDYPDCVAQRLLEAFPELRRTAPLPIMRSQH
jgi:esterase/lipase superfamily enzyme